MDDSLRKGRVRKVQRLVLYILDQVDVDRVGTDVALHQCIEDDASQCQELKLTLHGGEDRRKGGRLGPSHRLP